MGDTYVCYARLHSSQFPSSFIWRILLYYHLSFSCDCGVHEHLRQKEPSFTKIKCKFAWDETLLLMEPCIYITYDMLFKDEPLNIAYYLESLDRLPAIDFALGLLYNGNNSKITLNEYIELFLSKHNREFAEHITINYNEVLYRDIKSPTSVIDKNLAILRYRSIFVSFWEVHGECR